MCVYRKFTKEYLRTSEAISLSLCPPPFSLPFPSLDSSPRLKCNYADLVNEHPSVFALLATLPLFFSEVEPLPLALLSPCPMSHVTILWSSDYSLYFIANGMSNQYLPPLKLQYMPTLHIAIIIVIEIFRP